MPSLKAYELRDKTKKTPEDLKKQLKDLKQELSQLRVAQVNNGVASKLNQMYARPANSGAAPRSEIFCVFFFFSCVALTSRLLCACIGALAQLHNAKEHCASADGRQPGAKGGAAPKVQAPRAQAARLAREEDAVRGDEARARAPLLTLCVVTCASCVCASRVCDVRAMLVRDAVAFAKL